MWPEIRKEDRQETEDTKTSGPKFKGTVETYRSKKKKENTQRTNLGCQGLAPNK